MPEREYYHLVYISMSSFSFSQKQLVQLLSKSRNYNLGHGITGLLVYIEGHFMQLLEGPRDAVDELFLKIKKDERHQHVKILEESTSSRRQFADWAMAFLDFANPKVKALPGYSTFLETPLPPENEDDASTRAMKLLQYFKLIMSLSDDTLFNLADTIQFDS